MSKYVVSLLFGLIFVWTAGCSSFQKIPRGAGTQCSAKDDCLPGFDCVNGTCTHSWERDVIETITKQDIEQDTPELADQGNDSVDTPAEDIYIGEDTGVDNGTGEVAGDEWPVPDEVTPYIDGGQDSEAEVLDSSKDTNDIEIQEVMDIETPAKLPLGSPCTTDDECRGNHCIDTIAGRQCSRECANDAPCDPGFQCLPASVTGNGYQYLCKPWPDNLCKPCINQDDCPDGYACYSSQTESFCTRPCKDDACPIGFDCVPVDELQAMMCLPATGICECDLQHKDTKSLCTVTNDAGQCVGTMTCRGDAGWSVCNALIPEKEKCDGKDNNCNGQTDEGFTAMDWDGTAKNIGEACGTGVCASSVECRTKDSAWCPGMDNALSKELCGDGLDNNCNGKTDEGCENLDPDGDGYTADDCGPRDSAFHPGAPEPCCPLSIPPDLSIEKCDRNCDGKVTYCAKTDHDNDGFSPPEDCNDNDPHIYPGAPEKCGDGVDQDCDGKDIPCDQVTDNDHDGYSPPADCNDNNADIHPWAPEKCDYIDDNCDGVIDNGNPGGGAGCGTNVGECHTGVMVCSHYPYGEKLECMGAKQPGTEVCNGLDDNCNGKTDELWPDKGAACDGDDFDKCKNGTFTCKPDGSGLQCVNETKTDILEVCGNHIDDDCDGLTDEGCFSKDIDGDGYTGKQDCNDYRAEVHVGAKEPCCPLTVPQDQAIAKCDLNCDGKVTYCAKTDHDHDGFSPPDDCNDNDPHIYPGAPEKCGDGIDQDCDGFDIPCKQVIDKDHDGYSPPADCNDNNADIHPWAKEKCDYIDDNCDGVIDNGNPGGGAGPCGLDIGECKPGITVCVHFSQGETVECVPKQGRQAEKCDGLDNDCDGKTDENWPSLGTACDGPDSDKCKYGTVICSNDHKGTTCSQELVENIQELCDGLDDNCNGQTDEGFLYQGLALDKKCYGIGACGKGVVECSTNKQRATCSTNPDGSEPEATKEVCDGLDNDCNGLTDETFTYIDFDGSTKKLGDKCGTGVCADGVVKCMNENTAGCSTMDKASKEECDGLDNDCDGKTDETFTIVDWDGTTRHIGEICGTGACAGGIVACNSPLTAACSSQRHATKETCDNLDDNCNGLTDDNLQMDTSSCLHDGVCANGVTAKCTNGAWVCDYSGVKGYKKGIEVSCDDLDNNCNGSTDETWPRLGQKCDGPDSDQCKNGTYQCTKDKKMACIETKTNIKEICWDHIDNNCNGLTDEEGALGCSTMYYDGDQDGYGTKNKPSKCLCNKGDVKYYTSTNNTDCEDSNPNVHPGAKEIIGDGIDNNCDGITE